MKSTSFKFTTQLLQKQNNLGTNMISEGLDILAATCTANVAM